MTTSTQSIFELTLARPVTHAGGEHPALIHLWWRAPQQGDRLVQVYVDDELHDVTSDPAQRQMWLLLDRAHAHRLELLAVPFDQAWNAQTALLNGWHPRVHDVARMAVLLDETLPIDTRLTVQVDGEVYDESELWPSNAHRSGFGALFGEGAFGFDAATGPGLGAGELGYGVLGAGGDAWRWRRSDLATEAHELALTAVDRTGQTAANSETQSVTIDRLAEPAKQLHVSDGFTLNWQQ